MGSMFGTYIMLVTYILPLLLIGSAVALPQFNEEFTGIEEENDFLPAEDLSLMDDEDDMPIERKTCKTDAAAVKVFPCSQLPKKLPKKISTTSAQYLVKNGLTKCALPFGIIVAGASNLPDSTVLATSKILAELIDQNKDGVADVASMPSKMQAKVMFVLNKKKMTLYPGQNGLPSNYCEIDKYWHSSQWSDPESQKNRVRFEEVFHMMTQYGYGLQWPSQFSLDGSTNSTLLKECQKVTCNWWQHPENNCPDKTATSSTAKACTVVEKCAGTCKEASCNCVEWFHQVVVISAGMTTSWRAQIRDSLGAKKTVPKTKAGMLARLSTEMKALLKNPAYHQVRKPMTFKYP